MKLEDFPFLVQVNLRGVAGEYTRMNRNELVREYRRLPTVEELLASAHWVEIGQLYGRRYGRTPSGVPVEREEPKLAAARPALRVVPRDDTQGNDNDGQVDPDHVHVRLGGVWRKIDELRQSFPLVPFCLLVCDRPLRMLYALCSLCSRTTGEAPRFSQTRSLIAWAFFNGDRNAARSSQHNATTSECEATIDRLVDSDEAEYWERLFEHLPECQYEDAEDDDPSEEDVDDGISIQQDAAIQAVSLTVGTDEPRQNDAAAVDLADCWEHFLEADPVATAVLADEVGTKSAQKPVEPAAKPVKPMPKPMAKEPPLDPCELAARDVGAHRDAFIPNKVRAERLATDTKLPAGVFSTLWHLVAFRIHLVTRVIKPVNAAIKGVEDGDQPEEGPEEWIAYSEKLLAIQQAVRNMMTKLEVVAYREFGCPKSRIRGIEVPHEEFDLVGRLFQEGFLEEHNLALPERPSEQVEDEQVKDGLRKSYPELSFALEGSMLLVALRFFLVMAVQKTSDEVFLQEITNRLNWIVRAIWNFHGVIERDLRDLRASDPEFHRVYKELKDGHGKFYTELFACAPPMFIENLLRRMSTPKTAVPTKPTRFKKTRPVPVVATPVQKPPQVDESVRRERSLAKECREKIVGIIVARMRTQILKSKPEFEVERLPAFAENMISKAGWDASGIIARCCPKDAYGVIDDAVVLSTAFDLMQERAAGLYLHFLRTQDNQAEARARLLSRAVLGSTYQKIEEVARARLTKILQEEEAQAEEARKAAAAQAAIPPSQLVSAAQAAGRGGWGAEPPVRGVVVPRSKKSKKG